MGNNLFYKALAAISTVGVLVLAGTSLVPSTSQKNNDIDEALANTRRELTQARKDALAEVKEVRKEILNEIKIARKDALDAMKKAGANSNGSVWLVLHKGWAADAAFEKIEMRDMDQCELQAAIWKTGKRIEKQTVAKYMGYECIEGK